MPRYQRERRSPRLVRKASGNESFYHRQEGGLGDELVKLQIKQGDEEKKEEVLKPLPLTDVADGK